LEDVAQRDDDDDVWEAKSPNVTSSTAAVNSSSNPTEASTNTTSSVNHAINSNANDVLVQLPTPDDSSSSRSDNLDALLAAQSEVQLRIDDEQRSERLAYELQFGAAPLNMHAAAAFRRAHSMPVPVHTNARPRDAPRLTQSATPTAAPPAIVGSSPPSTSSLSTSPKESTGGGRGKHRQSPPPGAAAPPQPPPQPSTSFPSFSQIAATLRYWTTPDPVEQCCSAAKRGNVQQLLDALRNVDDINCVNRQGFTALMMAASHRARDCMQLLIERGIDVNARGKSKYTPLHWMAYCGYNEELRLLLAAGADLKARDMSRGQTPLHWALRQKHLKTASMLLESGANANALDNTHRSPLHVAAGANDTAQVALLLFHGASTRVRDSSGKLPVELLRDRSLTELFRLWENEDMAAVSDAAKRDMCTFTVTGTTMQLQFFFACETCKLGSSNGGGVCVACRRRCHNGHTLSTPHLGLFYCDCGAHVERYHCKALAPVAAPISLLDLDDTSAGTASPVLSSSRASVPGADDDADSNVAARAAAEEAAAFAEIAARLRPRSLSSPTASALPVGPGSHSSPQLPSVTATQYQQHLQQQHQHQQQQQHSDRAASTARADAVSIMSPLDEVPPPIASPRASSPHLQPVLIGFLSASNDALSDAGDDSGGGELSGKQIDLRAWLESLDLLFLERMFRRQRTDIDTVRYLGKEDLVELGVVGLGPLKKLLVEIERLRLHGVKTPHCELPPMAPPLSPPLSPTVAVRSAVHRRSPSGGELPSSINRAASAMDGDTSVTSLMHSGDTAVVAPSGGGDERRPLSAQRHFLSDIRKTRPIGEGAFGQVFEGVWQGTTQVAMKRLSDATHARAFEKEAMLLRDLRHPNVVMFLGLFHDDRGEMWIVTEFLSHGSLRHMLQRVGARVTSSALLLMAKDGAAGMKYLSQNHILHRDLAARNLLVKGEDKRFVVKVADFGLSRVTDGTYYSRSRKFPIKWTAPEALQFARFSTKSDVWSFGVVLWEMFEFGKVPYQGMSNRDAMQYVLTGSRLPKPDACPPELYRLMLDCWRADAQQRPTFQQIYDALVQALLRDTRPTVFALNVADGHVRAEPTAAVELRNDDEAYYADEFGVQISRPVRAEVTNELGYVESPSAEPRALDAPNRHASDAFRSYAFAAMYRDGGSSQQCSYDSEVGGGGESTTGGSSTFGLSSGMPSIFTIDPSLLTTRELTNKMDVPDRDSTVTSSGPQIDFIRDEEAEDDSEDDY
jgi:serine/threonine protein kinase/ankyrin repeat protein